MKHKYQYLESIRLYELRKIISILSDIKPEKKNVILEIGAGTGWQAKKLVETGYTVEAIDLEDSNYGGDRIWPITNYNGKHIPFPDNYFDIIFSSNVLEHILDLDGFQNEMQRVMKQDGIAIHIVPSASWRFWTNITHYPFLFKLVMKIIISQIIPASVCKSYSDMENSAITLAGELSKKELFRKAIFPNRHGEKGTSLSEMFYFHKNRWSELFKRRQWKIKKINPNRLFYTGHMFLGPLLFIQFRKYISYFLGSSCHIFVLEKKVGSR